MNNQLNERVAAAVATAATYVDDVDKDGRFPKEAIAGIKKLKLLGIMTPGCSGGSSSLTEVAEVCYKLAQGCGSTGLIYAMHQIEVAMLVNEQDQFSRSFLELVDSEQLLLASVTSEVGVGGSVRTSICAVEESERIGTFRLQKDATTISYGEFADGLLITARKNFSAAPGDQVLVTVLKDQFKLEKKERWDTLGMRGTCSDAFQVLAAAPTAQICHTPFSELAESIMLPVSHMLWSSVWLGIAADAYRRARAYTREQAKRSGGIIGPGNIRLVGAMAKLKLMHARIKEALIQYEKLKTESRLPQSSVSFLTEMNILKTTVSDLALDVVSEAMMICGIMGYKNNTPYSVGRHLRDITSARLMVSNDRIVNNMATFLMAQRSNVLEF